MSYKNIAVVLSGVLLLLSGCVYSSEPYKERYVSPQVQGQETRINLDAVEKALFDTKGSDLNSWMSAFEKRVNEIYEGPDIVSIDATRQTGKLQITGFVEKNKEPGFQNGEDKLFSIDQTGDVVNNDLPYRVSDGYGQPYHYGHYSLLDNPFIQALIIGHMFNALGPRYYTPLSRTAVLQQHRDSFRQSTAFRSQRIANRNFSSRSVQSTPRLRSRTPFRSRGFGGGGFGRRRWR